MARGDDGRGKPPWLEHEHHDRKRIIDEVLKRADFGVRPYARVSQMVRTYPTFAERLREEIARSASAELPDAVAQTRRADQQAAEKDPAGVARRVVRTVIRRFSPNEVTEKEFEEALQFLNTRIDALARDEREDADLDRDERLSSDNRKMQKLDAASGPRSLRSRAMAQIRVLKSLYEPGKPLDPRTAGDGASEYGRDSVGPLEPYPPGDARRKLWLNLWRAPDGPPQKPQEMTSYDLRMLWEGYFGYQCISAWEDFDTPGDDPRRGLIDATDDTLKVDETALDALAVRLDAYHQAKMLDAPFSWVGDLLAVSHLWCVPAAEALGIGQAQVDDVAASLGASDGPNFNDQAVAQLLERANRFARACFGQRDQTRRDGERDDLVVSVIGGGEAVLVCDFRPFSRSVAPGERAARALILNLTMKPDKTGRMIRRLLDIAAYRNHALRDYQYSFTVRDVLNDIAAQLSRNETDAYKTSGASGRQRVEMLKIRVRLNSQLDKLLKLSTRTAAVNQFLDGGVTGFAASAKETQALIQKRLDDLREIPAPGRQSLGGYLRRFDAAIDFIETVRSKYVAVRERIDEMVNLTRAELTRLESRENFRRAIWALIISGALLIASVSTIFDEYRILALLVATPVLVTLLVVLVLARNARFSRFRRRFMNRKEDELRQKARDRMSRVNKNARRRHPRRAR